LKINFQENEVKNLLKNRPS